MSWHGDFCWYELMAADVEAAQAFYTEVVGWRCAPSGMPDMDYRLLLAGDMRVAGLMPAMDGGPGGWTGYVAVDDCDAIAELAVSLGGTIHREPADIPGIGRFAVLGDPQGAVFAILQPVTPEDPPAPVDREAPGQCGWHELHARDWEAAWPFYEGLFGWAQGAPFDMGAMGTYQLFRKGDADRDFGGMLNNADAPHCFWMFYFVVSGIDAATERAKAAGARIMHGPVEVPGGQWTTMCIDPQGAAFALLSREP